MALAKTGNGIISIRGRYGGVYFKTGSHSQHIQAMPRVVGYARTGAQGDHVNNFSAMAGYWGLVLLGYCSALWAAFAIANLFSKPGKESKRIHGYNWYIYYAMMFPETERPPFWKPPHAQYELPDHIVTTRGKWTYHHTPEEWPDNYPTDYYWLTGTWNGKPYYRTDDSNWYLWWDNTRWALSISLGAYVWNFTYYSPGPDIWAWYTNPDTNVLAHVYIGKPAE